VVYKQGNDFQIFLVRDNIMAKKKLKNKIRLNSTANTGYFYVTKKNPKKPGKLRLRKYDPVIRQHVEFVEGKI
jgi:large subunit ribosomal protein L33